MKRLYNFLFMCLLPVVGVAQDLRPNVLVGFFSHSQSISLNAVKALRDNYVNEVNGCSRIASFDLAQLCNVNATCFVSDESIKNKYLLSDEIVQVNAEFLIEGIITDLAISSKLNDDGKIDYAGRVVYKINVLDVKNNTLAFSEAKDYTVSGRSSEKDALEMLARMIDLTCETIEAISPLEGEIMDMDYLVKDDKLETCYINIGLNHGVREGDYFDVKKARFIAGRVVYSHVGRIRVKEVIEGNRSLCKVSSKGKEIYSVMKEYLKMKTSGVDNAKPPMVFSVCKKGLL